MTLRLLVSYHYHRDTDLAGLVDTLGGGVDLFADSGAFSAATLGIEIKLADYAAWLRQWAPLFTVQANLDVIGDHLATSVNLDSLRDAGCDPLPVFHTGEPWHVLEGLCAEHKYVALGGLALHAGGGTNRRHLMSWLVRAFRIGVEHGTVFHGFGLTSASLVHDLPFYSVDSTSYRWGLRYGMLMLWDDRAHKMRSVYFRDLADVRANHGLLRRHGLNPKRVAAPSFARAGTVGAARDRVAFTAASARAYRFMEQTLTARHRVAPPPLPRAADTGTKVYLALPGVGKEEIAFLQSLGGAA